MNDENELKVPDFSENFSFGPDEKLFSSGPDWQLNAKILANSKDWHKYAQAYELAVQALCERLMSNPRGVDFIVYPICFLYRHYLELRLKDIIYTASWLLDRDCGVGLGHNLQKRWKAVRTVLEEIWPNGDHSELDALEAYINEYVKIDPTSQGFRYPADTKGNPTLELVETINIAEFLKITRKIGILLNGASAELSDYLSQKLDYEHEMRKEMGEYYEE